MPTFNYSARDKDGKLIKGSIAAADLKESKTQLFKMGYIPVDVSAEGAVSGTSGKIKQSVKGFFDKVSLDEMLVFNQQFHTIYLVGVPLLRGLQMIESQTENKYFRKVLSSVNADVSEGQSLDQAFGKHPAVFDATYVNLIRSGIASGKLDTILENISKLTEQQVENRERIKSATFYPKIVLGFISVVFFVVVYIIIPKIKTFFDKFGGELPPLTRFVVGASDFMVHYWYFVAVGLAALVYSFLRWIKTSKGREQWDRFQLKIPMWGGTLKQIESSTFAAILELLHDGGVPIIEALKLTRDSLHNTIFKKEVDRIVLSVERGEGMAAAVVSSQVFPPMVGGLLLVAEEAGAVTKVLNRISAYYNMRVNYRLDNLSKALEPILLFVIFGVVMVLALSIFMPLWRMNSLIKH